MPQFFSAPTHDMYDHGVLARATCTGAVIERALLTGRGAARADMAPDSSQDPDANTTSPEAAEYKGALDRAIGEFNAGHFFEARILFLKAKLHFGADAATHSARVEPARLEAHDSTLAVLTRNWQCVRHCHEYTTSHRDDRCSAARRVR